VSQTNVSVVATELFVHDLEEPLILLREGAHLADLPRECPQRRLEYGDLRERFPVLDLRFSTLFSHRSDTVDKALRRNQGMAQSWHTLGAKWRTEGVKWHTSNESR
jgi:hypothetical protein